MLTLSASLQKVSPPSFWTERNLQRFLAEFNFGFKGLTEVYEALADLSEANVTRSMINACIVMRELASKVEKIKIGQYGYISTQQCKYQLQINLLVSAIKSK